MAQATKRAAFPIEPPLDEGIEEQKGGRGGMPRVAAVQQTDFSLNRAKRQVLDSFSEAARKAEIGQKEVRKAFEGKTVAEIAAKESLMDNLWVQMKGKFASGNFSPSVSPSELVYFAQHWKEAAPKYAELFDSYQALGRQYGQFRKAHEALEKSANSQCTLQEFAGALEAASEAYLKYQLALADFGVKLAEHKLTWIDALDRALDVAMVASVMAGVGGLAAGGARIAGSKLAWQAVKAGAKTFARENVPRIAVASLAFTALEGHRRELVDEMLKEFFADPLKAIAELSTKMHRLENRLGKGELAETAKACRLRLEELGEKVHGIRTHLGLEDAAVAFLQNMVMFTVFELGFKAARARKAAGGASKARAESKPEPVEKKLEQRQEAMPPPSESKPAPEELPQPGHDMPRMEKAAIPKAEPPSFKSGSIEANLDSIIKEGGKCIVKINKTEAAEKTMMAIRMTEAERNILKGLASKFGPLASPADIRMAAEFAQEYGVSRTWFYHVFSEVSGRHITEGKPVHKHRFYDALHDALKLTILEEKHPETYGRLEQMAKDAGFQPTRRNIAGLYDEVLFAADDGINIGKFADALRKPREGGSHDWKPGGAGSQDLGAYAQDIRQGLAPDRFRVGNADMRKIYEGILEQRGLPKSEENLKIVDMMRQAEMFEDVPFSESMRDFDRHYGKDYFTLKDYYEERYRQFIDEWSAKHGNLPGGTPTN